MTTEHSSTFVKILGVKFNAYDAESAFNRFVSFMSQEETKMIFTPNPEIVMKAQEDTEFLNILNEGDLVVPDGIGIVIASKLHHLGIKERVPGIELMDRILSYCNRTEKSIYLYGAKPGVAELAAKNIEKEYPHLAVKGYSHGYHDAKEEQKVLDDINEKKPDVLFVALGAPRQEKWIYNHRKLLNANVAMGVGGSLDVYSGTAKRAPLIFRKTGFEWFYRLMKEPKRFLRCFTLPQFLIKVIWSRMK